MLPKGLYIPPPLHSPVSMVAWYIILHSQPSDTGSDDCLQDIDTGCTLYAGNNCCRDTRLATQNYNEQVLHFSICFPARSAFSHVPNCNYSSLKIKSNLMTLAVHFVTWCLNLDPRFLPLLPTLHHSYPLLSITLVTPLTFFASSSSLVDFLSLLLNRHISVSSAGYSEWGRGLHKWKGEREDWDDMIEHREAVEQVQLRI